MKKSKFSDCTKCPLQNQERVIGETNCQDDISKVEVLILAEAPANEEIKQKRPLVGQAGQVFREVFHSSGLDKFPHMINNVVFCANIQDGKTVNPPPEAIQCCKPNWQKLIEFTKPKLIVVMGSIPMRALDIGEDGITKKRGKFYVYNGYHVLLTVHPSYVMRQRDPGRGILESSTGRDFVADFEEAVSFLKQGIEYELPEDRKHHFLDKVDEPVDDPGNHDIRIVGQQEKPYAIKLPQWAYDSTTELFDCQFIYLDRTVLYTFKTPEGKKYHRVNTDDNYYYVTEEKEIEDSPMLMPVSETDLVLGNSPSTYKQGVYESDLKPEVRRSIDYRYTRKEEEPSYSMLKMFVDIEVYNNKSRRFPDPKKAEAPINAISFKIGDNPVNVWVCRLPQIDKKEPTIPEGIIYKSFANEYNLLTAFAKLVKTTNPDILTGWNFLGFDMMTIWNRMQKIGVDPNTMSPIGVTFVDTKRYGRIFVYGIHTLDLLDLYKELTYSVEESYKLDFICQKHLKTGKVSYDGTLDQLYEDNLSEFIRYSAVDSDLLAKLDVRLGHLDLKRELVRICSTTWKAAESTMGLVDPLLVSYAKNMNMVCRNAVVKGQEETIPGAYVRNPQAGRHDYVIDLDFASLYPSIICSCNIGPNTFVGRISQELAHFIIWERDKLKADAEIEICLNPLRKNSVTKKIKLKQLLATIDSKKSIITAAGTIFKNHEEEMSFLNVILTYLMSSRKKYKGLMADAKRADKEAETKRFDNIQQSYKILSNSIYGVLAAPAFRFFNLDLAKSITLTGQEVVKFSGYHLGQYMKNGTKDINPRFEVGYEDSNVPYVIYQDTDSIFVALGEFLIDQKKISLV